MESNLKSEMFKKLKKYSWWVQNALNLDIQDKARQILINLDNVALEAEQDRNNLVVLQDRIKFICQKEGSYLGTFYRQLSDEQVEKEDQLFSFFAELKAYEELIGKSYSDVKFLPESGKKQPDLQCNTLFLEAKRIRQPQKEKEGLRKGHLVGDINTEFRNGLKKKIKYFITDALSKFNEVSAKGKENRILVIDYQAGIDPLVAIPNYSRGELTEIFDKEYFSSLEKENRVTIWTRKYF